MKFRNSILAKLYGLFFLACSITAMAQKPVFLAPQPHKLLYADTVYNNAVAKKDTKMLAEAYYLYAKTYEATGDYVTSYRWFIKSLRILEPRGDSPELSRLYLRLASIEISKENYHEALKYTRLGAAIAKRINSSVNLNRSYSSMALIHGMDWSRGGKRPNLPKSRLDSVLFYYRKTEKLSLLVKDTMAYAYTNILIGNFLWNHYHDGEGCLSRLKLALKIYTQKKEDGARTSALHALATHYISTKQYSEAKKMIDQAREIYDQNPFNDYSFNFRHNQLLTTYYKETKNWKKAFEINEKLRQDQFTNYTSDRDLAVSRLTKEYETEKKDALLAAKDTELDLRSEALLAQQRFTITASTLLLLAGCMSFIFYRLYKKNQRISRQNELLVKDQNHRVKNNLQAISSLLSLQSQVLTDESALKAIEESRLRVATMAILHRRLYDGKHLAQVYLPDFLEEVLEGALESYGFGDIYCDVQSDPIYLSADQAVHLGLILNELVTNACKYAFPGNDDPRLSITCIRHQSKTQHRIRLTVADNGPGLNNPEGDKFHQPGFGMSLIKMETEQLYAKHTFVSNNGTTFTMDFQEHVNELSFA